MKNENKEKTEGILKKVTHMIEEPEKEETPQAQKPKEEVPTEKKTAVRERALITYLALLFGVAFVLVLLSFVLQQRDISQAHQNTSNALSRAEQLQEDNRSLSGKNQQLQTDLEDLKTEKEELGRTLEDTEKELSAKQEELTGLQTELGKVKESQQNASQAYELLIQAQQALKKEQPQEFRSVMNKLEEEQDALGASGKALYQELLTAMPAQATTEPTTEATEATTEP